MPVPKLRAVLDTSVLVAGVLQPGGPSGQVLRAFRRGRFTHATSGAILDEMVDVLTREKIQRLTKLSRQDIANLRVAMQQQAETASGEYQDVDLVDSDPKDNPVVAAALEMQAPVCGHTRRGRSAAPEGFLGARPSASADRIPDGISPANSKLTNAMMGADFAQAPWPPSWRLPSWIEDPSGRHSAGMLQNTDGTACARGLLVTP